MASPHPYSCPNCRGPLTSGLERCPGCGLRLRGPQAQRLWQLQQQIAVLTDESRALIEQLLQPAPTGPVAVGAPPGVSPRGRRSLSAPQILLGLGAVLLLSAAAAFLVVIWQVVGLAGQAAIMAGLTAAAALAAAAATRRSLPAAAETAAVVTTGLVLVDLGAAHGLDLAGLGGVPLVRYWACAAAVAAAVLVGCDLMVPRARGDVRLRRVLTYRPAAATLFAAATWLAVPAAGLEGAGRVAGLMLVALADLLAAGVAVRVDTRPPAPATTPPPPPPPSGHRPWPTGWAERLPASGLVLTGAGALAVVAHLLAGLRVGYGPDHTVADRYAAFGLLLVAPTLVALGSLPVAGRVTDALAPVRSRLPGAAVTWTAVVLVIPVLDAHPLALIVVAVVLAVALTGVRLGLGAATRPAPAAWLRVLTVAATVAQPVLAVTVVVLDAAGRSTLRALLQNGTVHASVALPWVVLPAVAWALPSAVAALRLRQPGWAWVTQAAVLLALGRAVAEASAALQLAVLLLAFGGNVVLAVVAARKPGHFWAGLEATAVVLGAVYAAAAVLAALGLSAGYLSLALFVVGVLTLVYAGAPARLAFAYLGSLVISAGCANLLDNAHVHAVEAYTAPLVVLLAGIGAVQWRRNRSLSTLVTAGPALSVALGPSLLTAIHDGDTGRLAVVTALAVGVLMVGLVRRWKAPVTVGASALLVVAITQGGPLIGYVPGWLTMAVGAAALLVAGVLWEKAVTAGRRAGVWFGRLT